ncbi:gastrin-releasing peptide [Carassius auratus]|uniref:Gastrin-releasing peptide n=1 Tax=Carassius auratus TaxID=7957 RepID=A0A6P6J3I5_CARAU|nr:gastrin-releasing peptide-like [Carassius auratus]
MSVMCLVWRSRLVVFIILLAVFCDVYASDAQPIGKVYPRGNHWAVGHLMGKKSTDEQVRPEDPEGGDETSMTTRDQDQQLERYNKHLLLPLLRVLMRGRMAPESMLEGTEEIDTHKLLQHILEERLQWVEGQERDRQVKSAEDVLIQALLMQDDNES